MCRMGKPPEHHDSIPTLDLVIELASCLFRQRRGRRCRRRHSVGVGVAVVSVLASLWVSVSASLSMLASCYLGVTREHKLPYVKNV